MSKFLDDRLGDFFAFAAGVAFLFVVFMLWSGSMSDGTLLRIDSKPYICPHCGKPYSSPQKGQPQ